MDMFRCGREVRNQAHKALVKNKVVIRDLNFYLWRRRTALKNVGAADLHELGEVTAFIGPSGCGKSTLLRVLNRMYDLYPGQRAEGEVLLDGENVLDPKDLDLNLLRSRVGMVFQKPTPFPMSIYDNIAFGIRLYEKLSEIRDGRPGRKLRSSDPRNLDRGERQAQRRAASACRAASSSVCASRAPWRSSPR